MITINGGSQSQRKYADSMAVFVCQKFNIAPECCHVDNNEFEVDVKNTLPLREMLVTLAHELVHVKQYINGEMPEKLSEGDYWDRPHEIEAHGRETGLFIRWAEKNNLSHLKWTQIG